LDIKLSVPLPPLTAQIYLTAEDVAALGTEEKKTDHVAALAEHPFVQRSKEEQTPQKNGPEIIIARKLGKKEKKRQREQEPDESDNLNGDVIPTSPSANPIQPKVKKSRREKKQKKEKLDGELQKISPVAQFDPYKQDVPTGEKGSKAPQNSSAGKSKTLVRHAG